VIWQNLKIASQIVDSKKKKIETSGCNEAKRVYTVPTYRYLVIDFGACVLERLVGNDDCCLAAELFFQSFEQYLRRHLLADSNSIII